MPVPTTDTSDISTLSPVLQLWLEDVLTLSARIDQISATGGTVAAPVSNGVARADDEVVERYKTRLKAVKSDLEIALGELFELDRTNTSSKQESARQSARADEAEAQSARDRALLEEASTENARLATTVRTLKTEITTTTEQHRIEVKGLKDGFEKELIEEERKASEAANAHRTEVTRIRSEHADEMTRTKSDHEAVVSSLKTEHAAKVDTINASHADAIAEIKNIHESALNRLKVEHSDELARLNTKHDGEIVSLNEAHQGEVTRLNKKYDKLFNTVPEIAAQFESAGKAKGLTIASLYTESVQQEGLDIRYAVPFAKSVIERSAPSTQGFDVPTPSPGSYDDIAVDEVEEPTNKTGRIKKFRLVEKS